MITRYSRKEMTDIWTDQAKYEAWLKVEIYAAEAWAELGKIPKEDVKKLWDNASFDIDRILEIEKETRHDVVAFTRAVSETLGEEKKWVHFGLTSTDVGDTAYGYLLKQANDLLRRDLVNFTDVLKQKAIQYQNTPCIGRTHGVHADITSFGLKFALWYDEMQRNIRRFEQAANDVEIGKISGAVGTFANTPPFVQDYVCEHLGINSSNISTQTLQRDRHAYYMATIATIGSTLEKIAVEFRHLQRTEVREVEEGFRKGQKGSSAMPHKRNPISSENITGAARVLRGYMVTAFENVPLWHERDISHSSAERIILPDATVLLNYMLNRFKGVVENLVVFEDKMIEDINLTNGVIFAQRVMTILIEKKGLVREEAYDLVQPIAMNAWENKLQFRDLLEDNTRINELLTSEDIDAAFSLDFHMRQVDTIFDRVGIK
jgi:adenylosuccinate lyase